MSQVVCGCVLELMASVSEIFSPALVKLKYFSVLFNIR